MHSFNSRMSESGIKQQERTKNNKDKKASHKSLGSMSGEYFGIVERDVPHKKPDYFCKSEYVFCVGHLT